MKKDYVSCYTAVTKNSGWAFKFQIGDSIRISQQKQVFKKGYKSGWSEEIFSVATRYPTSPPTYAIKDDDDELIEGKFYMPELQKVRKNNSFPIIPTTKEGTDDVYTVEKL